MLCKQRSLFCCQGRTVHLNSSSHASSSLCNLRRRRPVPHTSIRAAPDWGDLGFDKNPQNVDMPQTLPSPDFSPDQCVVVQMDALCNNDEPWLNHGIQTAYEFGNDVGGMERSVYFGALADLYHFDHFLGRFGTMRGQLVDAQSYQILQASSANASQSSAPDLVPGNSTESTSSSRPSSASDQTAALQQRQQQQQQQGEAPFEQNPVVRVQVVNQQGDGAGVYKFELARRQYGQRRGSWTTLRLTKE